MAGKSSYSAPVSFVFSPCSLNTHPLTSRLGTHYILHFVGSIRIIGHPFLSLRRTSTPSTPYSSTKTKNANYASSFDSIRLGFAARERLFPTAFHFHPRIRWMRSKKTCTLNAGTKIRSNSSPVPYNPMEEIFPKTKWRLLSLRQKYMVISNKKWYSSLSIMYFAIQPGQSA